MMTSSSGKISVLLALCEGNPPVTGGSPHKGQWCGAFMYSLIYAWGNGWANNRLIRHSAHYHVAVIYKLFRQMRNKRYAMEKCLKQFFSAAKNINKFNQSNTAVPVTFIYGCRHRDHHKQKSIITFKILSWYWIYWISLWFHFHFSIGSWKQNIWIELEKNISHMRGG